MMVARGAAIGIGVGNGLYEYFNGTVEWNLDMKIGVTSAAIGATFAIGGFVLDLMGRPRP